MDKKDRRIMEILAHNCRVSNSSIAEATNLSKDSVSYRIKNLEKDQFLTQYILFIDARRLGFTRHQILIQFEADTENKEEIYKKIAKHPFVLWANTFIGKYDLQVIVDAKNDFHLKQIKDEIFELCKYKISDHSVITGLYDVEFTNLNPEIELKTKFQKKDDFSFSSSLSTRSFAISKNFETYEPSLLDLEILKILADNPKEPLIEISEKVKANRKTVKKRISNLIDKKVISNFGAIPNATKFGYVTYALFVKILQDTPDELLREPFKKLNNIFYAGRMMGSYDLILYLYAKNPQELNKTIDVFKKTIGKYITHSDLFIQDRVLVWRQFSEGIYSNLKKLA